MATLNILRTAESSSDPRSHFSYLSKFAGDESSPFSDFLNFVKDEVLSRRPALSIECAPLPATHNLDGKSKTSVPSFETRATIPPNYLEDFLSTFLRFEKMVFFAVLLCIEALLFDAVVMPMKAMWAAFRLTHGLYLKHRGHRAASRFGLRTCLAAAITTGRRLKRLLRIFADFIVNRLKKTQHRTAPPGGGKRSNRHQSLPLLETPKLERGSSSETDTLKTLRTSLPITERHSEDHNAIKKEHSKIYGTVRVSPGHQSHIALNDLCALIEFSVLIVTVLFFRMTIDVSVVYHFVRGQALLKLYVLYNMLEITERMWRSLEIDMLDDLRVLVDRWINKTIGEDPPPTNDAQEEPINSVGENYTLRFLWRFALTILCVIIHTAMHLCRGLLLCIAMNSSESGMFLLLVSNNWGELKSTVFKKQTESSLWPIAAADVVERFQIYADILFVISQLYNSPRWSFLFSYPAELQNRSLARNQRSGLVASHECHRDVC
eukprot:Gregarina_sp_Poly_1__3948@NODE_2188_length_2517_cov_17_510612_g1409_i0_p1_GENE_NODE_2188_length_2517_cov_17_510612_g1409_i0NODE_2188_length_2517_cov_17_510612_g1409_i0_p1_ORF_typecomplete_len492_score51_62DUF747/PF05346_11/8_7e02DUF747/PF05346_11/2_3e52_NODE_2188_length_2517_cov_17_510612_g1409_i08112286